MTSFGLTSIENAESEITERINACNSIENRAKELEPAYGLSPQNVEQAAHQKEKALQTELALLKEYLKELDEAQINYQELCQNFQQYKNNVYEKSLQAMEKNKNALFSGSRKELFATGLDTISLIDEEGFPHLLFETEEKSKWKNESEKTIKECCLLSDGYLVTMTDGSQKEFNSDGFIIKIQDRNENYILITRDKDEKIQKITSSNGELLNFTYEGSFIKSIVNSRDPSHSVIYTYKNDLLTAVKDSDGDLVINNYDEEKHLTQLKKCDGSSISFVYGQVTSAGKKLVTATVNEEAYAETFDYDLNKRLTIYTDHDGNSTSYIYDEKFRTRKEVQSNGSVIESFYDDYGNVSKVIQNGNKIDYEYVNNNKTKAVYEDSSYEEWTYDSYNQITSYKDRDGIFYEYIRDSKGNLLEYKEGGQSLYSQIFDSKGRLTKLTVYGQYPVITEYQYDSFGNIKSESCDGLKKEYLYDKRNRLTKVFNNGSLVNQYSYNGRNITSTDYKGLETSYTINGRKDLTEIIQKDLHSQTIHKKRIEYDKRHLPLRLYLSDGKKEILSALYFYTPFGKLAGQAALPSTGEECWVKLYEYKNGIIAGEKQFKCSLQKLLSLKSVLSQEDVNQLISQAGEDVSIQKYDYKIQSGDRLLLTFTDALGTELLFDYDSNGNLVMQQDGNGAILKRTYTKAGRLQSKETEYGGFYEYKYNPGGNLLSYGEGGAVASNAAAATTTTTASTYEYYPDGSLKKTVNPDGQYFLYNYDRRGRLVSIQSQIEQTNYEYDDFDRLVKESNSASFETYDYSTDGRTLLLTRGGKYKMLYELDAFGNVIKEKDGNGNARRYEYNCRNQLVKAYDAYENLSSYEYNALGFVSLAKQADGAVTEYQYNYLGLLQKITDDCGLVYKASYDKTGLLLTEKNRGDSEKTYEYDKAGRLIKIMCGGQTVESYSYALGNKSLTVSDGLENPYLYNYDFFGRLKSERNRLGNESFYSYDFQGQLKEKKDFNGQTMKIEYSLDNSVKTISYSDGSKILFVYDANGNITQGSNSYGKLIYQYDKGGKLIYQKDLAAGEEIFYEYDAAGNRISLKSSFSDIHYTYGKNNELLELYDKKQGIKINLLYDSVGREIQRKFSNQTIQNTYYDRAGRIILITQKSAANELLWGQAYVYGPDGKRSAGIDHKGLVTLYEYNSQGQLAGVWYPYSQELEDKLREEAQENGFVGQKKIGQNKFLTSAERNDLALLLEKMQYGLSFKLLSLQIFIKESFVYDKNGNRISKINDFGKIDYSYDSENRLLFTGMNGKSGVKYSYDCNGNLLTQESALKTKKYAYNSQNRLIYCELIDKVQKTYVRTSYAYDALGRRVLVQDNSEAPLRTVYDGLSFDVIWQGVDNINHFNFSGNVPYTADATGRPTGDRYRYLGDEALMDENRYFYLEQGNYKAVSSRYQGARSQLNINACVAAQSRNDGHQFFTSDIQGSVSSVTDTYGYQLDSYTYDAFGSVVHGDLSNSSDLGYLSKPYDPSSSLYDYGYRDYSSATSRFTTPDPIRDGPNWFSYCTSDPINFVDLWGLFYYNKNGQTAFKKTSVYVIRNDDGLGNEFNSSLYIRKEDVFGNVTYSNPYVVGANCKPEYDGKKGSTTPDGVYYLTRKGTSTVPLNQQEDGSVNSFSFKNILVLMTSDPNLSQEQRDIINYGDRFLHADEYYDESTGTTKPYNNTGTPGGAGCIISHTQTEQDRMIAEIMDGVVVPEAVSVIIYSLNNLGCGK